MKILKFVLAGLTTGHDRCGNVSFGQPGQFLPTTLSSYPGSGNTWVRYLIEEFTGTYTGSIYNDNKLYLGGFEGEKENWKDGRVVVIKAHTYREDRDLGDAILLIRNPYDAILAEFNRAKGGGDHHTGVATNADFQSDDWTQKDFGRLALRWYRLYYGNLVSSRKTLPVFYEDMKQDPVFEMQKVASFLNQTDVDYEDKLDCLFGESSKKFKRSSDRGYDPYTYVDIEKLRSVNEYIRLIDEQLQITHHISLPESYLRDL